MQMGSRELIEQRHRHFSCRTILDLVSVMLVQRATTQTSDRLPETKRAVATEVRTIPAP